jgi:hypothetical protein
VFFYFSGHADFTGQELFYLLSDYEKKVQRRTSIENSELDSLLRGLKPSLAVKVIDACHSGIPYIKDSDAFKNYIKGTKEEFNKCYFMFSSHQDQASYQNREFSLFTRSFGEAIAQHSTESIRLKDIIDFVSDAFLGNSLQTPFFVVQADFTEPFCQVDEALRQKLQRLLSSLPSGSEKPAKAEEGGSLVDLVSVESNKYCSQDEATNILEGLAEIVMVAAHPDEAKELYDVESKKLDDYSDVPDIDVVANWLHNNKHNLFIHVVMDWKTERYLPTFFISPLQRPDETDYKTRRVRYPKTIRPATSTPYCFIRLRAIPKFPNINATVCYIIPLVSETELRIFTGFGAYEKTGWTECELAGDINWNTRSMQLRDRDGIRSSVEKVLKDFWDFTLKPLKKRFGLIKEETVEPPVNKTDEKDTQTNGNGA